jgi:hypothetical protein
MNNKQHKDNIIGAISIKNVIISGNERLAAARHFYKIISYNKLK